MKTVNEIKIILGSGSPRRKLLLGEMGVDFKVVCPQVDETKIDGEIPKDQVMRLSLDKARYVADSHADDLVVGADTIVVLNNEVLGKPKSEDDALNMLRKLSGQTHTVFTGLSLVLKNENVNISGYDSTEVIFRDVTDEQITEYIKTGEPMDKAGSYGIQGMGAFLVEKYNGELDTVIGFPTKTYKKMYEEVENCLKR